MATDVNKFQFRLVLLGSNGTGKTAILNRFLFKKFETKYKPTVEDLFSKDFDLGAIEIKVDFLDTSGSMQFPAMRRLSITTGNAFLIVYALDDPTSFEVLKMCVSEIQEARPADYQELPIVFAGNKSDTPKEERKVTKEQVSNYVYYELPRLRTKVIECSCKNDVNVDSIFKAYLSLARVRLPLATANCSSPPAATGANFKYGQSASGSGESAHKRKSAHSLGSDNYPESHAGSPPKPCNSASSSSSNNNNNNNNNNDNPQAKHGRSASIRRALGVRKSCDASIISSMRKVSLSAASPAKNSHSSPMGKEQQADNLQQQHQHQQAARAAATTTTEVVLRDAMEAGPPKETTATGCGFGRSGSHSSGANKLAVDQGQLKPRSRSLIWRPSRKASRTSSNESSECRVT